MILLYQGLFLCSFVEQEEKGSQLTIIYSQSTICNNNNFDCQVSIYKKIHILTWKCKPKNISSLCISGKLATII